MRGEEDIRHVQLTGKSTFIISLPRKWVNEVNLNKGETLSIIEQNDKSLLLVPKSVKKPTKATDISVIVSSKDKASSVMRKVTSLYLIGFNLIRLKFTEEKMGIQQRDMIKDFVRRMLVGTEIIADSKNEMTLQILMGYPQLSVSDALRRISIIVVSMHRDAINSLIEPNKGLVEEVIRTDDEVDRFNFYIIRQLKAAVEDARILGEIGLRRPRDCLGYRLITKSVERVGDHAVSIAKNSSALKIPIDSDIFQTLNEMSLSAVSEFEESIKSLFEKNYLVADSVIERKELIDEYEAKILKQILEKKFDAETTSSLRLIVESIRRTAKYGSDIAEIVLNMTVLD